MKVEQKRSSGWASLTMASDDSLIVAVSQGNAMRYFCYESPAHLRKAIDKGQIRAKKWIFAFPRSKCFLKQVSLPASSWQEAHRMVEFELSTLVPISANEIVYSCLPLKTHDDIMEILVCAARLDSIQAFLKPFSEIGVEPQRIVMSSMGICIWSQKFLQNRLGSAGIIAALNGNHCEVVTAHNSTIQHATNVKDAEQGTSLPYIAAQEILHHHQKIECEEIEETKILVVGSQAESETMQEILSSVVGVDYTHIEAASDLVVNNSGLSSETLDRHYALDIIVAEGLVDLAQTCQWELFNFVPPAIQKKRTGRLLRRKMTVAAMLVIVGIGLLWLILANMNWRMERLCRQIQAQIDPIEHTASSVESKRQQLKAIERQVANRQELTTIFEDIYGFTPESISLSELTYTSNVSGDVVQLRGQADMLASAFGYTEAMEDARVLRAIQIDNAQQVARQGGSVVEFRAHCTINREMPRR